MVFRKVVKYCLLTLVFLLPLFWLPFTVEAIEFNKGYLLLGLTAMGILAWLAKMVFKDKQLCFCRTEPDLFILGFVAVMAASTLFSRDPIASLLGSYGRFWPSLTGVLSMAGLYFLVTNFVIARRAGGAIKNHVFITTVIKTFLLSSLLVIIFAFCSLFNVWAGLDKILPGNLPLVMKNQTFTPVGGSLEQLTIFVAFIVVLAICLLAFRDKKPSFFNAVSGVCVVAGFVLLAIVDFWPAWVVMSIGCAVLLCLALWKKIFQNHINRLGLAVFFLILSLFFLSFNPLRGLLSQTELLADLSPELILNQRVSWELGLKAARARPLVGSGLGNFSYVFSRLKPDRFLTTVLWNTRFDRAGSHIAETLATTGIPGLLSYLLLIAMFFWFFYHRRAWVEGLGDFSIPLAIGVTTLLAAQFVFYQNTTLAFCFWLFLALAAISGQKPGHEKTYSLQKLPVLGLVVSLLFWVVVVGAGFLGVTFAKLYWADIAYRTYLQQPKVANIPQLVKAADLGQARSVYSLALGRSLLGKLERELAKKKPDRSKVSQIVADTLNHTRQAVNKSPHRVATVQGAAMVYRDLAGLVKGSARQAINYFQKARQLEPNNPIFLSEMGQLYFTTNQQVKAEKALEKAVALKPDHIMSVVRLALLEEDQGRPEQAVSRLQGLVRAKPRSAEARFQLGRVFYNKKQYSKAIDQLQIALELSPRHANARYTLGLCYQKLGRPNLARKEFQKLKTKP